MNFIREHLKGFIGITALVMSTIVFIASNELIAQMLPDAQELTFVSCEVENGDEFVYTGSEIKPNFEEFVFEDKDGNLITIESADFAVKAYLNNVEMGYGDIELALDDYRNTIILEDVFQIVLGQVNDLKVANSSKEYITLLWNAVAGADGYVVSKSADNGETFTEIQNISTGLITTYSDRDIELNSTYMYQVTAFTDENGAVVYSDPCEAVEFTTPLADPVATGAEMQDSSSIVVSWDLVEGAVGYQVYRSTEEFGTYELLAEITDSSVYSYTDTTCEIGVPYFYHVVACQQIGETMIWGTPSNVLSASTTPDKVSLSGASNTEFTAVILKWKEVKGADGYEVYRRAGSGKYALAATITDGTLTWAEDGLTETEKYTYKVCAYKTVDGVKVYGSYSGEFEKVKKVVYNYAGSISGGTGNITKYAGTRYVFGGSTPDGWDCSGFVQYVLQNEFGISVARTAAGQASGGASVSVSDRSTWKAGDILCYKNNGSYNHVAIYLGNGQMIHALNSKYGTFIQNVDTYEGWDDNNLASVKRY